MVLIIGLGNPGGKFKKTRHNLGFMVVDQLQKIQGFSDWQTKKKFQAEISEGHLYSEKIILVKPQTFMNDSGQAVRKIAANYKTENILVVHDDLDLEFGKMKIVKKRGSAGHKGVESIIQELKSGDFIRLRLGIKQDKKIQAKDFVLKKFSKDNEKILKKLNEEACQAIETIVEQGIEKAQNRYNKI